MVKISTDSKVYAVAGGGILRWVKTETMAKSLYGEDWNKKIEDIPDVFFTNYKMGDSIDEPSDFNTVNETAQYTSINSNKNLIKPVESEPIVEPAKEKYTWDIKTISDATYKHNNLNLINFSDGFLASWYDNRNGQNEIYYQKTDVKNIGTGVAMRVSDNISDSTNSSASYDGTNLYFMWEDSSLLKRAIYLQKRNSIGFKLNESVFASTTYATSRYPDLTWNEALEEYGVVWWDTRKSGTGSVGDLFFKKMTKGGLKTGSELRVSSASSIEFKPKTISAGDNFGALWQENNEKIRFALINKYSALSGSIKDVYTALQTTAPRIAWSGQNFGVVWADKNGDNQDIYFMILDKDGNNIGSRVAITSGDGDAVEPDILWDSSKFYISYTSHKPKVSAESTASDIYVVKVNVNGVVSGIAKNISNTTSTKSHSSNLAKNDSIVGISWLEDEGSVDKILGAVEEKQ